MYVNLHGVTLGQATHVSIREQAIREQRQEHKLRQRQ